MVNIHECPVCGAAAFDHFLECKDFSISLEDFSIIQCKSCHFILTSPRPDEADLGNYYKSSNYISHSDSSVGIINKLYHFIRNFTLRQKVKFIKSLSDNPKLLDIGSGAGYFLNCCKINQLDAMGIEPDAASRLKSISQFDIHIEDESYLLKIDSNEFDIISLWHVLEHIPNLTERLEQIEKILKPNGILLIAVPNCNSLDAKFYQKYWAGYDVPRHLWHFTPSTMERLLSKYNFKLVTIKPMYFDAFYVSMLSEKYKNSKLYFVFGFSIGLLSNLKGLFSKKPFYSSQIYVYRKS